MTPPSSATPPSRTYDDTTRQSGPLSGVLGAGDASEAADLQRRQRHQQLHQQRQHWVTEGQVRGGRECGGEGSGDSLGRFEDDDDDESEDESEDDDWSEGDSEDWSDDDEEREGEEEEQGYRKGAAGFDKAEESGRRPARGRRASVMAMRKVWWRVGGTAVVVVGLLRRASGRETGRLCCCAPACKVSISFFLCCVEVSQGLCVGGPQHL